MPLDLPLDLPSLGRHVDDRSVAFLRIETIRRFHTRDATETEIEKNRHRDITNDDIIYDISFMHFVFLFADDK